MFSKNSNNRKTILAIAAYSGASIFGPMLFFGISGFFLDKKFNSGPKFLLIGIGVAFVFSNILLFKRQRLLSKKMSVAKREEAKKEEKEKE